jgi:hypothetical protein
MSLHVCWPPSKEGSGRVAYCYLEGIDDEELEDKEEKMLDR